MNINEFRLNNLKVNTPVQNDLQTKVSRNDTKPQDSPFAQALREQLDKKTSGSVEFSRHAMERITQRSIDMTQDNKLERLNKAVTLAQEKGANETLVLIDQTAFVVNVRNNKVITTMSQQDMIGNVFTNIDSTVII